jgi:hypothetical protein
MAQDANARGARGVIGPRLPPDHGIERKDATGESFGVVVIGQRDGSLQRAIGHFSQGAGVGIRRHSRRVQSRDKGGELCRV